MVVVPAEMAVGSDDSAGSRLRDLRVHPFSIVWSTRAVGVVELASNLVDQRLQHISFWGDSGVGLWRLVVNKNNWLCHLGLESSIWFLGCQNSTHVTSLLLERRLFEKALIWLEQWRLDEAGKSLHVRGVWPRVIFDTADLLLQLLQ